MFENLSLLSEQIAERIPAISIAIGKKGKIIYSKAIGQIMECKSRVLPSTRFDIASITKVFSGIAFMKLVEDGIFALQEPIFKCFPEFNKIKPIEKNGEIIGECDCSKITWYHALTHTTGIGWTRPKTRPSLPKLGTELSDIYDMPMAYMPGEHIVYSDIPIILMGKAMEMKTKTPLDVLINNTVIGKLNLKNTGYLKISEKEQRENIVPTEYDDVFRKRRIHGIVHDENAFLLNGVSAHAGIFSTAEDLCMTGISFLECLKTNGIIKTVTANEMIKEHVRENGDRRGLMWQLSGQTENMATRFLSEQAFGHSGFTGCFMWMDPVCDLTIVFLSNDVYNGRDKRCLNEFREYIIKSIVEEKS